MYVHAHKKKSEKLQILPTISLYFSYELRMPNSKEEEQNREEQNQSHRHVRVLTKKARR